MLGANCNTLFFAMFRKSSLLFLFCLCISTLYAEQYKLVKGQVFYKNADGKEVRVFPDQTIPNENVYVRMHEQSKDGDVFVVSDTKGKHYTCTAPKEWPGVQLQKCLQAQALSQDKAQLSTNVGYGVTAIRMGDAEEKRAPHFHYLCALVSEFEDAKWPSFPYKSDDTKSIKNAFNTIRSQQQYLSGKQYILSNPLTTRYDIVSRLDSINQQVGEGDLIILYLSSHGEVDADGQFQFIFKDSYTDNQPGRYNNTLSKSEINDYVNQLTAKKARVLFFLDACYAGAVLDNNIHGEAAYYLSTNDQNPAYYNMMVGSPFAIALMETMTGALNGKDNHCFIDNMVQVGSLGNYLSNAVFTQQQQQRPICNEHAFSPSYVLWRIHSAPATKVSSRIRDLERQANSPKKSDNERASIMIKLGDCYYTGKDTPIDFDQALDYYRQASDLATDKKTKGEAYAKISNCMYYGNPYQDSLAAFENAYEAAKLGNAEMICQIGRFYFVGYGVIEDSKAAVKWYKRAIKNGSVEAINTLGVCYGSGKGVPKNYKKAAILYQEAAEQGNAWGQSNIGWCYYEGRGVEQDYVKAFEWYKKSAEQGNANGQVLLGVCYESGDGIEQNYTKAVELYTKSAEQGNALGQWALGNCYFTGEYLEKNYAKAVEWYSKSAKQGNSLGQYMLGNCYYDGIGVDQDYAEAVEWYKKSAEQGYDDAQNVLGNCYYDGTEVEQDYIKAVEWYSKSAEQGNAVAQCSLGTCYYDGTGVEQDYAKAVEWYSKSAEQGDANAQDMLGDCYSGGIGVEQDFTKAFEYYTKSAEQGNAYAQNNLGYCYETGEGVTPDYSKAFEWYFNAAEQGSEASLYHLGTLYYNGLGVEKDTKRAFELMRQAVDKGEDRAKQFLEEHKEELENLEKNE